MTLVIIAIERLHALQKHNQNKGSTFISSDICYTSAMSYLKEESKAGHLCGTCRLEKFVTCSVCEKRYVAPGHLPCGHLICQQPCLTELLKDLKPGDLFQCPSCNNSYPLPEDGIKGFDDDLFTSQLLDLPDIDLASLAEELMGDKPRPNGFRHGSENMVCELRKKQAARKKIRQGGHATVEKVNCIQCQAEIDYEQIKKYGPPKKERKYDTIGRPVTINPDPDNDSIKVSGTLDETYCAPEEGDSSRKSHRRNRKKKNKKQWDYINDEPMRGGYDASGKGARVMVTRENGSLVLKDRCPSCDKRPATDSCFHCKRKVCTTCLSDHTKPIVLKAAKFVEDYNTANPAHPIHGVTLDDPKITLYCRDRTNPNGFQPPLDTETYFTIIKVTLSIPEMEIYLELTNYIEEKLSASVAHRKAIEGLILRLQHCDSNMQAGILAGDGTDLSGIQADIALYSNIFAKLRHLQVEHPKAVTLHVNSLSDLEKSVNQFQNLSTEVAAANEEDYNATYDQIHTIQHHISSQVTNDNIGGIEENEHDEVPVTDVLDQGAKPKRKRNRKKHRGKASTQTYHSDVQSAIQDQKPGIHDDANQTEKQQRMNTKQLQEILESNTSKTDTKSDGVDKLNWGTPNAGGAQLVVKGAVLNRPDGKGNPTTNIQLPTGHLPHQMIGGNQNMGDLNVAGGIDDGRVPIPGEFPFSMEHLYNQCKLLAARYQKSRGGVITKKLTEEISLRAEPGGPNGSANISVKVKPRKASQFNIPPDSEAAAAISAIGGEVNEDNFDVEYAVDKDRQVRPYLRPKNRKMYNSFNEFEFDTWKTPGSGSGITADGGVIYGVGRDGHIEIKGDEEQEKQFNNMVMDALDDMD